MKRRIVLVGDYNRSDFLYVASLLHTEVEFYFIEFINEHFFKNKECLKFGHVIYWKNFSNAYDLINKIRPDTIIFYFIESYNHVALNVAARAIGIPTIHLEHGLRFKSESLFKESNHWERSVNRLKKLSHVDHLYDRYAGRMFFWKTIKKSEQREKEFLDLYYSVRKRNSIQSTFEKIRNPLRLADRYISFSPLIFDYHKKTEGLPDDYPVCYVGIPFFDHFAKWRSLEMAGKNILFIDQPLYEQKILGWTIDYKKEFVTKLCRVTQALDKKLYIKPHPWNEKSGYEGVSGDVIMAGDEWEQIIPDINVVLGFSSTLLMPFMAMDHITCFTLEMHPEKADINYSDFLLQSKACEPVYNFEELKTKLIDLESCHLQQKKHKAHFIENWMYKFDGNSSQRLRKVLLKNEAV